MATLLRDLVFTTLSEKGKKDDHGPDKGSRVVGEMLKMPVALGIRQVLTIPAA